MIPDKNTESQGTPPHVFPGETNNCIQINGRRQSLYCKIKRKVIGHPRNVNDPRIFHKISLIALLSWIGLGADGLSSSSYGPSEAFNVIVHHPYIAIFLAIATAATVFIISYSYSKIIEYFPHGGGGYNVATHTLGKQAGLLSGSALLIDYVLTITVSLAACGEAIFSFLPPELEPYRLAFKCSLIVILIILNLRGTKESVLILAPIFLLFIGTHILLLGYGILSNVPRIGAHVTAFNTNLSIDLGMIGFIGILALFLRSFSLGAGTYTGIEAISNGLSIMREPRVKTAKKTMLYMAISLALVAGALYICYYLSDVTPTPPNVPGPTLNAILATSLFGGWPAGVWIAFIIIFSEALLLFVAAQTGFIGGPRVMANMAVDSWFPKRFASLSERLTMHYGVLLMGFAAFGLMFITGGDISMLVIMYAINVFITFSLSQLGMSKFFISKRKSKKEWKKQLTVQLLGLILCLTILSITIFEKFGEGGWTTLILTLIVILLCFIIHRHYSKVRKALRQFDEVLMLSNIHLANKPNEKPVDPKKPTAVLLVNGYRGFGVNTFLYLIRHFPDLYKNVIFVSVAEIDSGTFKGIEEVEGLKESVKISLLRYVKLARRLGFSADYRMDVGTDVVETVSKICESIATEFPNAMFFAGKVVFRNETIFHKILHNETAYAIQRRLQFDGIPVVVLPVRLDI